MTKYDDLTECNQHIVLSLVLTGGVSILAGLMILLSFVVIKKIRTYTFGLIFVMSKLKMLAPPFCHPSLPRTNPRIYSSRKIFMPFIVSYSNNISF